MSTLSSGEQHLVHTTQSVLYHILNVNSVHHSKTNSNPDKKKYHYINIILDEIELYFHPEYQRRFVFELLDKIDKIRSYCKKIKGINILFCTHSPFILSDIPKQNVLFLVESKTDRQAFAANISTMLSNSFFMTDLIGEFSKNKINQLLEKLNKQKEEDKKDKDNPKVVMEDTEKEDALKFIELIDEPILKYKLKEMFRETYSCFWEGKGKQMKEKELKDLAKQYGIKIEIKSEN